MKALKSIFSQFRGLNARDPASWPTAPKVVMLVMLFVAGQVGFYYLDWETEIDGLEAGKETEAKLKEDYVTKFRQAANLELYRVQLKDVNTQIGTMLRQLPNRSQMEALITDINQAGVSRSLQFDLFKPAPAETKKEIYAELPIAIKMVGAYHDMGRFAADIGQLSRIVTLNDVNLQVNQGGTLVLEATAKTFRYLDEGEQGEQRRIAAEARKKNQPARPASNDSGKEKK